MKKKRNIAYDIFSIVFFLTLIYFVVQNGVNRYNFMGIAPLILGILTILFPRLAEVAARFRNETEPDSVETAARYDTWPYHLLGCSVFGYIGFRYAIFVLLPVLAIVEQFPEKYEALRSFGLFGAIGYTSWLLGLATVLFDKLPIWIRGIVSTSGFNATVVLYTVPGMKLLSSGAVIFYVFNAATAMAALFVFNRFIYRPADGEQGRGEAIGTAVFLPLPILVLLALIIYGFSAMFQGA